MDTGLDPFPDPASRLPRIRLTIPWLLHDRLRSLRRKLEARFRIRLDEEGLIEYLCVRALERMEEWERRTRGTRNG